MGRTPLTGGSAFRFLPAEVVDMEKALDASSGATPARSIVEGLAEKFTNSTERNSQKPVQWKQVWNWFQNRRHAQKAKIAKTPDKQKSVGSGAETPPTGKAVAAAAGPSAGKKPSDVLMDFEAKSARDGAWYDVSSFISKRTGDGGEPEVRVRFAGFGSEEDEWVNVATAVRQRSLPCEATECVAVLPGDLILCFQEGNEQALYFDADILDVQRRRHDVRGCRCRFWVRYRHDQTEEVVPLRKVCRRPETELRLQQAKESGASSSKVSNKESAIEASTRALNATPSSSAANPQTPATAPATPPVTPAQPSATPNTTTHETAASAEQAALQGAASAAPAADSSSQGLPPAAPTSVAQEQSASSAPAQPSAATPSTAAAPAQPMDAVSTADAAQVGTVPEQPASVSPAADAAAAHAPVDEAEPTASAGVPTA